MDDSGLFTQKNSILIEQFVWVVKSLFIVLKCLPQNTVKLPTSCFLRLSNYLHVVFGWIDWLILKSKKSITHGDQTSTLQYKVFNTLEWSWTQQYLKYGSFSCCLKYDDNISYLYLKLTSSGIVFGGRRALARIQISSQRNIYWKKVIFWKDESVGAKLFSKYNNGGESFLTHL